jgi:hypothetical protein
MSSVQETATAPKRRRRAEMPQLPLKEQKYIFRGDIPKFAAQEGRKSPGKGTIQKLTSRAGREAGKGPRVAGFIGVRPVYEPQAVLDWLDSLVTLEPRAVGITPRLAAAPVEQAPPIAPTHKASDIAGPSV